MQSPSHHTAGAVYPGQMLVLISSDGKRVSISRAIATEASYVLRDLLDGWEPADAAPSGDKSVKSVVVGTRGDVDLPPDEDKAHLWSCTDHSESSPNVLPLPTSSAGTGNETTHQNQPPKVSKDDVANSHTVVNLKMESPLDYLFSDSNYDSPPPLAHANYQAKKPPALSEASVTAAAHKPVSPAAMAIPPPIELPFPYATSDILELVCAHMKAHYCLTSVSTENNYVHAYPTKTCSIPRPMKLPLDEYLDATDRHLTENWDELTTVLVIKAATLLNYEELLKLASAKLASFLCEKSIQGIRIFLRAENDFSPHEEAELLKEQQADTLKFYEPL